MGRKETELKKRALAKVVAKQDKADDKTTKDFFEQAIADGQITRAEYVQLYPKKRQKEAVAHSAYGPAKTFDDLAEYVTTDRTGEGEQEEEQEQLREMVDWSRLDPILKEKGLDRRDIIIWLNRKEYSVPELAERYQISPSGIYRALDRVYAAWPSLDERKNDLGLNSKTKQSHKLAILSADYIDTFLADLVIHEF